MERTCTVAPTETAKSRDGTICVGSLNATPAHAIAPTVAKSETIITKRGYNTAEARLNITNKNSKIIIRVILLNYIALLNSIFDIIRAV